LLDGRAATGEARSETAHGLFIANKRRKQRRDEISQLGQSGNRLDRRLTLPESGKLGENTLETPRGVTRARYRCERGGQVTHAPASGRDIGNVLSPRRSEVR
jgi:hypothetical protein